MLKSIVFLSALSLGDLQTKLVSLDPLLVEIPAESLGPKLLEEIQKEIVPIDGKTQRVDVDEIRLDFIDGGLSAHAKGHAALRYCRVIFGKNHCTPWIRDVFRARVDLSLSVKDWVIQAQHSYTEVELANDALDAIKRNLSADFYRPINKAIDRALLGVNERNLREELEELLEITVDENARADVTVSPAGVSLSIKPLEIAIP